MRKIKEKWKPIAGYKGYYEVSNRGGIRSLTRTVKTSNGRSVTLKGKIRHPYIDKYGYCYISLCKNGKPKSYGVHSLVLKAFKGKRPKGLVCCHENGNPSDNRIKNLRYDTMKGNSMDMHKHGTVRMGNKATRRKLTERKVVRIRKQYRSKKKTKKDLAIKYGVSVDAIRDIVKNRTWKHIDDDGNPLRCTKYRKKTVDREPIAITAFGKTMTIPEWEEKTGISRSTIHRRYKDGWKPEDIVSPKKIKKLTCRGKTLTLKEWETKTGIAYGTLLFRLRSGWDPEEILTTEPKIGNRWRDQW